MKKQKNISDKILGTVNKILPGFGNLFKKLEKSKTFGVKISEIKKEIDRKFKI
jgi:hypothetical protein